MNPELTQALLDATRAAGRLSLDFFDRRDGSGPAVEYKGETDLVTAADRRVEEFLRERLGQILPDAGFLGEEGTDTRAAGGGGRHFVVDPIDGTVSFVHGLPNYAVAVALKEGGETVFGAVYCPPLDQMYHAVAGGGAWKDGRRLQVSGTDELLKALAATGFACVRARRQPDNLPIFTRAIYKLRGIRRFGSAALDLCLVAEGKLDLYWEICIQPWDIAAGTLILREAGGRVTDLDGHGGAAAEQHREILATQLGI